MCSVGIPFNYLQPTEKHKYMYEMFVDLILVQRTFKSSRWPPSETPVYICSQILRLWYMPDNDLSHECFKEQIVELYSSLSIYFKRMCDKFSLHQKLSKTNINFRLRVNHNQKGGIFFCKSIWFLYDFFDLIILSMQLFQLFCHSIKNWL